MDYRKILKMPTWTEIQLEELSGSLKEYIKIEMENKKIIVKKLEFIDKHLERLLESANIYNSIDSEKAKLAIEAYLAS